MTTSRINNHYKLRYSRKIEPSELEAGHVTIKLDPYRVARIYNLGGGPREHAVKKLLRGTDKGHALEEMWREVMCCATRALEMIEEDRN